MKKQSVLGVFVFVLAFCFASAPAHAQDGKITLFGGYSYQVNSLGTNDCEFDECDPAIHGYSGSIVYSLNKYVGIEGNFAGHNGNQSVEKFAPTTTETGENDVINQDIYTYVFGPRLTFPVGHFSIYTHFLVGAMHAHEGFKEKCLPATSGENDCPAGGAAFDTASERGSGMAFMTGGGLNWNHGRWGLQILEIDYVHAIVNMTGNEFECDDCETVTAPITANNVELSTGVRITFGKH